MSGFEGTPKLEKGPEKIPTKEALLKQIGEFAQEKGDTILDTEEVLEDADGPFLMKVNAQDREGNAGVQYLYRRRGLFLNPGQRDLNANKTTIDRLEPDWGDQCAEFDHTEGTWNRV